MYYNELQYMLKFFCCNCSQVIVIVGGLVLRWFAGTILGILCHLASWEVHSWCYIDSFCYLALRMCFIKEVSYVSSYLAMLDRDILYVFYMYSVVVHSVYTI